MKRFLFIWLSLALGLALVITMSTGCQKQTDDDMSDHTNQEQSESDRSTKGKEPESMSHEDMTDHENPARTAELEATVIIENGEFSPPHLAVKAGTTVKWINKDTQAHHVMADDESFESGSLEPGESFSHRFEETGDVDYHCHEHREQKGMVMIDS